MDLHPCLRCGSTLTAAFRFCPRCGLPSGESEPVVERRPRRRRPQRTRSQAVAGSAGRSLASAARAAKRLQGRRSVFAPALAGMTLRARRLLAAAREAARLLGELIVVTASSLRECVRSTVVLRRLYVRRSAVIYDAGCAALNGDVRKVERAKEELRLLDELIAAATIVGGSGPRVVASQPEAPTEESVLLTHF